MGFLTRDRKLTSPGFSPSRAERHAVVGSPPARDFLATILAGAQLVTDFEGTRFEPDLPYNQLTISNASAVRLTLLVGGVSKTILANQEIVAERVYFSQFRITNEDGAAATGANTVEYVAERAPVDADKDARLRTGQRLFGGL